MFNNFYDAGLDLSKRYEKAQFTISLTNNFPDVFSQLNEPSWLAKRKFNSLKSLNL